MLTQKSQLRLIRRYTRRMNGGFWKVGPLAAGQPITVAEYDSCFPRDLRTRHFHLSSVNITATFLNRDGSREQFSEVQYIRHAAWPRHCLLRILPVVYRLHALPRPRLQHAVCEEYCPPAVGSFDSSAKLEHRPRLACTEEKLDQRSGAGSEFNRYQWLRIQWLATAGRHPIWHVQLVQHAPCEVARISKS